MNKKFALAFAALLCFASQGYARHPFANDPTTESPSVLVKAEAQVDDAPVAAEAAVVAQPEAAPVAVQSDVIASDAAPMPSDGSAMEPGSVIVSDSAPVYRSRTSRRSNNGLIGELIELERRKNAWIRRNIFGR